MARRKRSSSKNWISSAVKRPGQLHRDLGVSQGKKIPRSKLVAAAKRGGKAGQRARFALNVGKSTGGKKMAQSKAADARADKKKGRKHLVRGHKRKVGSKKVRVRGHRRRHPK